MPKIEKKEIFFIKKIVKQPKGNTKGSTVANGNNGVAWQSRQVAFVYFLIAHTQHYDTVTKKKF